MKKLLFLIATITGLASTAYGRCQVKPYVLDTRGFGNTEKFRVVSAVTSNNKPVIGLDDPNLWKLYKSKQKLVEGRFVSATKFSDAGGTNFILIIISTDNAMVTGRRGEPPPLQYISNGLKHLVKSLATSDVISIYTVNETGRRVLLPPTTPDNTSAIQAAFSTLDAMKIEEGTQKEKKKEPIGVSVQRIINTWRCNLESNGRLQGDGYAREIVLLIDEGYSTKPRSSQDDATECDSLSECPSRFPVVLPKGRTSALVRQSANKTFWCERYLLPWLDGGLLVALNELVTQDGFTSWIPLTRDEQALFDANTFTKALDKMSPILRGDNTYVATFASQESLDSQGLRMQISIDAGRQECLSRAMTGQKTLAIKTRWLKILLIVLGSLVGLVLIVLLVKLIVNAVAARRERAYDDRESRAEGEVVAQLTVIEGPDLGQIFTIDAEVMSMGRGSDMDITLADPTVSRYHCQLSNRNGIFQIKLTEGKSGVLINGIQVPKGNLRDGDILQLGQTKMEFKLV